MHTFSRPGCIIHYNPDMSGILRIEGVAVPAKAILEFMAEYVCRERIARLENATVEELLGLEFPATLP